MKSTLAFLVTASVLIAAPLSAQNPPPPDHVARAIEQRATEAVIWGMPAVNGIACKGSKAYRLTVPVNAPVNQYWSATVRDRATNAFIRDSHWSIRSSRTLALQKSTDGSVYFAPKAPDGKETNWIPTNTSGQFEALFPVYGP